MATTPPPAGLQYKAAPGLLEPPPVRETSPADTDTGVTAVDPDTGTVEALVAVTGVIDDVGDLLEPGCFGRTLVELKAPPMIHAHDWQRPIGQTLSVVELLPGDPRLPRTAPDGSPWPATAGALRVRAKFLLGTRDGREAWERAKAFGSTQSFSIGYKVRPGGSRQRGKVRVITDLDLFEYSPVLHGANRLATQLSVKGAHVHTEHKSTADAVQRVSRSRLAAPIDCCVCGQPAGGITAGGALPSGYKIVCRACLDTLDALAVDGGVISRADLAAAAALDDEDEISVEELYDAALVDEQPWDKLPDGRLTLAELDDGQDWSEHAARTSSTQRGDERRRGV